MVTITTRLDAIEAAYLVQAQEAELGHLAGELAPATAARMRAEVNRFARAAMAELPVIRDMLTVAELAQGFWLARNGRECYWDRTLDVLGATLTVQALAFGPARLVYHGEDGLIHQH